MAAQEQSSLVLSSQNEPFADGVSEVGSISVAGKPSICKLPNEILEEIFKFATLVTTTCPPSNLQWGCIMIALVCKRWSSVVERVLFNRIVGILGITLEQDTRLMDLLLCLEEKPSRYDYVQFMRLFIDNDQPSSNDISIVVKGMSACRNIRSLSLTLDFDESHYPFLESVKTLQLRYLHLRGMYFVIPISVVSEFFNIPTLEQVSLAGYGWSNDNVLAIAQSGEGTIRLSDEEVKELSLPSFEQFRGVKRVLLVEPWTNPLVTKHMLSWSQNLEEITIFEVWEIDRRGTRYTSATIARLLDDHHGTLKKIHLDWTPDEKREIPDFSGFTQLEHLYISASYVFHSQPSEVCPKIVAPKLRRLILDLNSYHADGDATELFGEEEFEWIRDFLATMRSENPDAMLEEIFINFGGEGDRREFWTQVADIPPQHYLVEAAQAAQDHGVVLRYTEPVDYEEPWIVVARNMPPSPSTDDS